MAENICTVMETMEKDSTAAAVTALVRYGVSRGLITGDDAVFAANSIFDLMQMDPSGEYMPLEEGAPEDFTAVPDTADGEDSRHFDDGSELASILKVLLDDAVSRGIIDSGITSRDLFDTKIMGLLTPPPTMVRKTFADLYREDPRKATDYYYDFSQKTNYIRKDRIAKDEKSVLPVSVRIC